MKQGQAIRVGHKSQLRKDTNVSALRWTLVDLHKLDKPQCVQSLQAARFKFIIGNYLVAISKAPYKIPPRKHEVTEGVAAGELRGEQPF